jgi:glycosyltransferase involved in cell wall biosynthesis
MKKILMITQVIPYYYERGASFRVHMMVKGLTELGYEVHLVCTHLGKDINLPNLHIHRALRIPFIKNVKLGFSIPRAFMFLLLIWKSIGVMRKEKCDIIQAEDVEGTLCGIVVKLLYKTPLIYNMESSLSRILKTYGYERMSRASKKIERFLYNNSDFIIANWEFTKSDVLEIGEYDVKVIHDRLETKQRKPEHFLKVENYIVYAGGFTKHQGVELLISAFKSSQIKDLHLVIVGGQPPKSLLELGKSDNIHFVGRRSLEETNWIIKNSMFSVLPRMVESYPGMKLIHYIQIGRPILAVDAPGNILFLENMKTALFCEPTVEDMSSKIEALYENDNLRKELENNLHELGSKFSFENLKKDLSAVYNKI